jgi:hypothetical protein
MHRALEKAGYELTNSEIALLTSQFRATSTKRIDFEDFKRLILLFDESPSHDDSPLLMRKRNLSAELSLSREMTPTATMQ